MRPVWWFWPLAFVFLVLAGAAYYVLLDTMLSFGRT